MENDKLIKKIKVIIALVVFMIVAALVFTGSWQVKAQTTMTLAVLPNYAELELVAGETVTVDLYMTNAVDANGFDITLTYDPAVVNLDSWAHGGIFSNLYTVTEVNEPGTFRLAAVQLAQSGVAGEGSVLKLTFSGVGAGTSDLTITSAEFADTRGAKIYPDRLPGSLAVFYPRGLLTGTITMQGQSTHEGIPAALSVGQTLAYGPYEVLTNDQSTGNLVFSQVVQDTYTFTTNQPRYLNVHTGMDVTISVAGDTSLSSLHLYGGNAVWTDNQIDISDASVVGAWYELPLDTFGPDAGYHPDVNFDGIVNIQDLALVAGNFDLTSESAYAGWTP